MGKCDWKYEKIDPPTGTISKGGQRKGRLKPLIRHWYKCKECGDILGPGEIDKHNCKFNRK